MESQSDPALRGILNRAFLCVPDGMPTVWVGRAQGHRQMRRVYGPDFMMEMCRRSHCSGYRHFLYGGAPGVAELLKAQTGVAHALAADCGNLHSSVRAAQRTAGSRVTRCRSTHSKPDILWVGLSTPKQERFMAQYLRAASGEADGRSGRGV